jgi:dihydrofolate reductase
MIGAAVNADPSSHIAALTAPLAQSRLLEKDGNGNVEQYEAGEEQHYWRISRMKSEPGDNMVIIGSGAIVSQLTQESVWLMNTSFVVHTLVLGRGRTLFEGIKDHVPLKRINSRTSGNGNVILSYVVE